MNARLEVTLPWGPSMNSYWCKRGRITFISKAGKAFRKDVEAILFPWRGTFGVQRLFVSVTAFPPDKRTRDLDNLLKPLLDAMQHAALFTDDSQIDRLLIERGNVIGKPGQLQVTIETISRAENKEQGLEASGVLTKGTA